MSDSGKKANTQDDTKKIQEIYDKLKQGNHSINTFSAVCKQIHTNASLNFTQLFADTYIDTLVNVLYSCYYDKQKIFSSNDVSGAFVAIFSNKNINFKCDHIKKLTCYNSGSHGYMLFEKYGRDFTEEQTIEFINATKNNYSHYENDSKKSLITFVESSDWMHFSEKTINMASECQLQKFITKAINKKIVMPQQCLKGIISMKNLELIKLVLLSGCKLDTDSLLSACKTCEPNIIKFILDNKIAPTQKCFDAILTGDDKDDDGYNGYSYRRRKPKQSKTQNSVKSDCIALLQTYGYKVTYNDVTNGIKNLVAISNFASLGITVDDKLMDVCSKHSFYPYKSDSKLPISCLRNECEKAGNLPIIKNLINKDKLKPDMQCLKSACKHKSNIQTIKFLIEKGNLTPDAECLNNLIQQVSNRCLTYVSDLYLKSVMPNLKNVKAQQNSESDSESDDSKDSNDTSNSESDDSSSKKPKKVAPKKSTKKSVKEVKVVFSDSDSDSESDNNSNKNTKEDAYANIKSESDSESDSESKSNSSESDSDINFDDSEPEIVAKPASKKIAPKKVAPPKKVTVKTVVVETDTESESDDSEVPIKVVQKPPVKKSQPKKLKKESESESEQETKQNVTLQNNELCDIPETFDFRVTRTIDDKLITMLNLKKNTAYSFVDIRKNLLTYLSKEKLLLNDKLKVNKQLSGMCYRPENELIALSDLDKFVYSLVKNAKVTTKELAK